MVCIWKIIIIIILLLIDIKNYFIDNINENIDSKRLYLSKIFNKIYSNLYFLAKKGVTISPSNNKKTLIKLKKLNIDNHIYNKKQLRFNFNSR